MQNQFLGQRVRDLFPSAAERMKVLAICQTSLVNQTGAWAWLLEAENQAKGLLYTSPARAASQEHLYYAALAALGRHLGFAAQVLALLPDSSGISLKPEAMPRRSRQAFLVNFEAGRKNPAKSQLSLGPDILIHWPGSARLRKLAVRAMREDGKADCQIIERCANCGEWLLDGLCGCGGEQLIFPGFQTPLLPTRKCGNPGLACRGLAAPPDWPGLPGL